MTALVLAAILYSRDELSLAWFIAVAVASGFDQYIAAERQNEIHKHIGLVQQNLFRKLGTNSEDDDEE